MNGTTEDITRNAQPVPGLGPNLEAIAQISHEFAEAIRAEGNISVVFGAPMQLDKHKVIPVARIEMGFGGGLRATTQGNGLAKKIGNLARVFRRGFGAGGGGGLKVVPIGFIHENEQGVQFKAIEVEQQRRK